MGSKFRIIVKLVIMISISVTPRAFAADTAIAGINISSNVPQVFSVTTRGVPGDVDLSPNVIVNNRRIGLIHLKYNINVATLTISSSTASGAPQTSGGVSYSFQGGFKVAIAAGCASVDPTYNTPFVLTAGGVDVKSALASALVSTGIEEDCDITASWVGSSSKLPLAGVYSMTVNVTMTSN